MDPDILVLESEQHLTINIIQNPLLAEVHCRIVEDFSVHVEDDAYNRTVLGVDDGTDIPNDVVLLPSSVEYALDIVLSADSDRWLPVVFDFGNLSTQAVQVHYGRSVVMGFSSGGGGLLQRRHQCSNLRPRQIPGFPVRVLTYPASIKVFHIFIVLRI